MATRWTQRLNPLSWITRRGNTRAPVAPQGQQEYTVPAAYQKTFQDDYSAADRPAYDASLEYFAKSASDNPETEDFEWFTTYPEHTSNPPRPRTWSFGYNQETGVMRVSFRDGAKYDYCGITPEQVASATKSPSFGKWMARNGLGGPGSGTRVD